MEPFNPLSPCINSLLYPRRLTTPDPLTNLILPKNEVPIIKIHDAPERYGFPSPSLQSHSIDDFSVSDKSENEFESRSAAENDEDDGTDMLFESANNRNAEVGLQMVPVPTQQPHLIYLEVPSPLPVGIGYEENRRTLHGQPLAANEAAFRLVRVFGLPEVADKFGQPPISGEHFVWKYRLATNSLGNSEEAILKRVDGFMSYLENRQKQQRVYEIQMQAHLRPDFFAGSIVKLRIPGCDRSNLYPAHMAAKVIDVIGAGRTQRLKLQTRAGIIERLIPSAKVYPWGNDSLPIWLDNPPIAEITVIQAFLDETSYSSGITGSLCHCKAGCKTMSCTCKKNKLFCSTKCHNGDECSNKNV